HQLESALGALVLLVRVQVGEARQAHSPLVDARVVLHRAGAERVEARIDPERPRRELGVVADELGLGQLRQPRRRAARELGRNLGGGDARVGDAARPPARAGLLVDELHAATACTWRSTSASRSMSAAVRFSVRHTSRTSSIPSYSRPSAYPGWTPSLRAS